MFWPSVGGHLSWRASPLQPSSGGWSGAALSHCPSSLSLMQKRACTCAFHLASSSWVQWVKLLGKMGCYQDCGLKQQRWRHRFLSTNPATGGGKSSSGTAVPSTAAPWLWAWVGAVHSHALPHPTVHGKLFGTIVSARLWTVLTGVLTVIISVIWKGVCKSMYPQQECVCLVSSVCLYCRLRHLG